MPDSLVLRQSPQGYVISPTTPPRTRAKRPRRSAVLKLEENDGAKQPPAPPENTEAPPIIGQPKTLHCACGCKRNVERGRVVAVSITKDGELEAMLGYVETLGCSTHIADARTKQGLYTAFLHPEKVKGRLIGTPAAEVLAETYGYVRPKDHDQYRIA